MGTDCTNKDWRLEIITNEDLLNQSYDVKTLIKIWIIDQISLPFVEIFYSIEKYFPFESIHRASPNIILIFKKIIENNCSLNKTFNILNANQANNVHVIFDLKIPFILKEYETLSDCKQIKELINKVVELEKYVKFDLESESTEGKRAGCLNDIQDLESSIINEVSNKSLYKDCHELIDDNILNYYLSDLVKIKYDFLISNKNDLEMIIIKLAELLYNYYIQH